MKMPQLVAAFPRARPAASLTGSRRGITAAADEMVGHKRNFVLIGDHSGGKTSLTWTNACQGSDSDQHFWCPCWNTTTKKFTGDYACCHHSLMGSALAGQPIWCNCDAT